MPRSVRLPFVIALLLVLAVTASAQTIQTPEEFFGFQLGTDGEMARYPKVLDYLQHVAANQLARESLAA